MKNFKKLLAVVLSLSMVLGMASVVMADEPDDDDAEINFFHELTIAGSGGKIEAGETALIPFNADLVWDVTVIGDVEWTLQYGKSRDDVVSGELNEDEYYEGTFVTEKGIEMELSSLRLTNNSEDTKGSFVVYATIVKDESEDADEIVEWPELTKGGIFGYLEAGKVAYIPYDSSMIWDITVAANVEWSLQYGMAYEDVVVGVDDENGSYVNSLQTIKDISMPMLILQNTSENLSAFVISVNNTSEDEVAGGIDNPIVLIPEESGEINYMNKVDIEADGDGAFFEYIALDEGRLVFTMRALSLSGEEGEGVERGYQYTITKIDADGKVVKSDVQTPEETGNASEYAVDVKSGDKVVININSYDPNSEKTPKANDVNFELKYAAEGSKHLPLKAEADKEYKVGVAYVYYTYTAEKDGSLTISLAGKDGWTYSINDGEDKYDTPEAIELKAGESVLVKLAAGDLFAPLDLEPVTAKFSFALADNGDIESGFAAPVTALIVMAILALGVAVVAGKKRVEA